MFRRMASPIYPSCKYLMKFDGCSKGNPGHSGAGAVIYKNNNKNKNDYEEIWAGHQYVGHYKTNNEAEYSGLILGLQKAQEQNIKSILVCGDSQLIIRQMKREYKVKSPQLIDLFKHATELAQGFDYIDFMHIYREHNQRADELSNMGIRVLFEYEKNKSATNK